MSEASASRPHQEYTERLRDRRALRDRLARQERLLGNAKVVVFLLAGLAAYLAFGPHLFSPWLLPLPLALPGANVPHGVDFGALMVWGQQPAHLTSRLLRAVVFVVGLVALAVTLNYLAWFPLATPDEMHEELFLRNVILLATLGTAGGI